MSKNKTKTNTKTRNLYQMAVWQRGGKGYHGKNKIDRNRNDRRKAKQQGWE